MSIRLEQQVKELVERVEQLEQQNTALTQEVRELRQLVTPLDVPSTLNTRRGRNAHSG